MQNVQKLQEQLLLFKNQISDPLYMIRRSYAGKANFKAHLSSLFYYT